MGRIAAAGDLGQRNCPIGLVASFARAAKEKSIPLFFTPPDRRQRSMYDRRHRNRRLLFREMDRLPLDQMTRFTMIVDTFFKMAR